MESSLTFDKVKSIITKYIFIQQINYEIPLTCNPYALDPRSMAAIFLDIESEFDIDLNNLYEQDMDYSVASIITAIEAII